MTELIPSTALGLLVLLVLVIPGTVYAAVRTAVGGRGPHDREIGTRILRAIIASALLDAVYLSIFGNWLLELYRPDDLTQHARLAGATGLTLGIVMPALLAYVIHGRPRVARGNLPKFPWIPWPKSTTGYETTPTAWDWAVRGGGKWIRIRVTPGQWVGGWFGSQSFVSTYPEPRDIFIEDQHHVDPGGVIGEAVEGSAGVWLAIEDGYVIEWVEAE